VFGNVLEGIMVNRLKEVVPEAIWHKYYIESATGKLMRGP